jgi:hypothetical protein
MSTWNINLVGKKPKLKNPILIEGLPGIGNVGKIAVDFMIYKLKAKKLYDIFSYTFPHSVFVNEDNLVELPSIEIYYKKMKNKKHDLLFLAGDVQPVDEVSSYEFSDKVLDIASSLKCKEVVTLGGVGLQEIPKKPKVYCTANNKNIIKRYKNGIKPDDKLFGIVGPIIGVSGLLVGLAKKRKMDAISFLAETYGHPMYLGIKGSKEVLKIFNKKLGIELNLNDLDKEIKEIESEMVKRAKELEQITKQTALKKFKSKFGNDIDYIG